MTEGVYSIVERIPALEEYIRLRAAAGLSAFSEEAVERGLKGTFFSALAFYGETVVGMARLIGDGGCFFQVVDVAVKPAHQGQEQAERMSEPSPG